MLAKVIQTDVITCYDGVSHMTDGIFVSCNGLDRAASGIIERNARRGCLVDTLTAELIRHARENGGFWSAKLPRRNRPTNVR